MTITPDRRDYNALSDEEFRSQVRHFIEANYPQHLRFMLRRARRDDIKDWWKALYHAGWIAPNWPVEYGGMGLNGAKMVLFLEEMERHGVVPCPDKGITHVGPTLMKFGTEEQKKFYLPRNASGEYIWCQGYSEPNAGSDLANLQTAAELRDGQFVINGQKTWTSMAHDSTHIFVLVRTEKNTKRKQQGISFLLVDLATPGITIRPIRNIAGHDEFCEIFFDNVAVPSSALVGGLNDGWKVAKALLSFERLNIGSPRRSQYALRRLHMLAKSKGLLGDSGFVERYAALHMDVEDLGALYGQFVEQVKRGESLGQDVSSLKVWGMETWQRLTELLLETGEEEGVIEGVQSLYDVQIDFLTTLYYARSATIYGGSSEIQRNILSKYVLHLPS